MAQIDTGSLRILHLVGGLERAGVETWLLQLMTHLRSEGIQMDIAVYEDREYELSDDFRRLGCRIFACGSPANPLRYAMNVRRLLRREGPYDAVHTHVNELAGLILLIARLEGVPVRLAHSHLERIDALESLPRRMSYPPLRYLSRHVATMRVACSEQAAASVFGVVPKDDRDTTVIHCGIDLDPFSSGADTGALRGDLGLPEHAFVYGHVGRFMPQKNHTFLLSIAREVIRRDPSVFFLLVGNGDLEEAMKRRATELGINGNILFAGVRKDVPALMTSVMDAFVFPSLYEGLGNALVEAQAAGLPCIISDTVPPEADILPDLIRRISLDEPPAVWADHLLEIRTSSARQTDGAARIRETDFNITNSASKVLQLYQPVQTGLVAAGSRT